MRGIMLLTGKQSMEDIQMADLDKFPYFPRPEEDEWMLEMTEHLVEERSAGGLDESQLEWLEYLCTS